MPLIMSRLILLFICSTFISCSDSDKDNQIKVDTVAILKTYSLDSNYFKVSTNRNGRDELTYLNEYGQKEVSFVYDNNGLFEVKYFLPDAIWKQKTYVYSIDTLKVIHAIINPKTHLGKWMNEYTFANKSKIGISRVKDIFNNTKDTFWLNEDIKIKLDLTESQEFQTAYLIMNGVDDYCTIDTTNMNLVDVSGKSSHFIHLNTQKLGMNSLNVILYCSKYDNTGKHTMDVPMFFKKNYFVKGKKPVPIYDENFFKIINRKIESGI
jgi:hypothetical protein